ncbi:MAG TPA: PBP1A family penicillin-binding protein [Acidimicrobiales bacterium]|nr:PBP1A family penicillin-binding protein [Acidimicrobiales bacterium]
MRRPIFLLLAVIMLGGACSWSSTPLATTTAGPLDESTKIFASDGTLVATLHAEENRETVPLRQIPKALRDAVVAIEDQRFWDHRGVDAKSVLRAVYANASEGRVVEGGSTITQQYVKNELVGPDRTVRRKLQEAALAFQLESRYTKERILELYLNTIYFGNGAYGVEAAAHEYFGMGVEELTLGQAALLAGMIRAPSRTDPYRRPELASARRQLVLEKMVETGVATPTEAEAAAAEPLVVAATPADERYAAPYFVERVKRFILDDPRFGPTPAARRKLLFQGGLRVFTTLDLERQAMAEAAIAKVLSKPGTDPSGALVSIEPRTGFVRALVGGRDFFGGGAQAKFDLATQGQRPAGSSFKPFVLASALEAGIPLSRTYDAPARMSIPLTRQIWNVENYEGGGGGRANLIEATVRSINTVYAQLILDVGPAEAVATAARMGITTPLLPYPSAVLGTNDVTPIDMAAAYGTFANRGVRVPPTMVTKVAGPGGVLVFEHAHAQKRVLEQENADALVGVLQGVVDRGTAVKANIGRPVAGKTGTGQEWRDAWFVGFTPELVTSVWVGFPEKQRSMIPPATRILVTGGSWPAEIWQLYSSAALARVPITPFPEPPPLSVSSEPVLIQVPAVVGMPVEEAELTLGRAGLRAVRRKVVSDEYPPGYAVSQVPEGFTEAPGGSAVTLEVSSGPATATVPDLLDRTREDATARVVAADLDIKVIIMSEPKSPGAGTRKGKVWKQSPQAGTRTERGITVTIWVNPADGAAARDDGKR